MQNVLFPDTKVLVVDDSRILGQMLKQTIQVKCGRDSVCVRDLATVKYEIHNSPQPFFAAVTGLTHADAMHGEVVDYLTKHQIPTIVYTADYNENTRQHILAKHIVDYVIKRGSKEIYDIVQILHRLERNALTKVLVVDDTLSARQMMRKMLEIHNFQCFDVESGTAALQLLNDVPDIRMILTDYHMPNMNGFQLTEKIRDRYSKQDMVIIGISTYGDDNLSARFIKAGANDFLNRPFLTEEFYCRVNHSIEMMSQMQSLTELNIEKNTVLGMVAHDLRSPLGSVQGVLELMLYEEEDLDPETRRSFMLGMHNSTKDMLNLLNDLLDVSAIESGHFSIELTEGRLTNTIKERINLNRIQAKRKKIEVKEIFEPVTNCWFDNARINQVLDNLISNAIKYSPLGSLITVRCHMAGENVRVEVIDQGAGIPEKEQKQLFGTFQKLSTKPTAGETSMGLAIARKIILAHKGNIGVESEVGKGSLFYFQLNGSGSSHT